VACLASLGHIASVARRATTNEMPAAIHLKTTANATLPAECPWLAIITALALLIVTVQFLLSRTTTNNRITVSVRFKFVCKDVL
jgi:hypothetical protein